jgi:hypothetical protein
MKYLLNYQIKKRIKLKTKFFLTNFKLKSMKSKKVKIFWIKFWFIWLRIRNNLKYLKKKYGKIIYFKLNNLKKIIFI